MSKKKTSLTIKVDLSNVFSDKPKKGCARGFAIEKALATFVCQMKATGLRKRTISNYELHVNHFIEELNVDDIYLWLSSMNVSNQTKLTRLKCLKVFLGCCFDNEWIDVDFWRNVKIKVDGPVKEGATDRKINILLPMLDLTHFIELRDTAAILIMSQTGIRVGTLSQLEHKHVN